MVSTLKWKVLRLLPRWANSTAVISLLTDRPCHLWLRYSDEPVRYRKAVKMVRGLPTYTDIRICFTRPSAIEQVQDGDTLIHHFSVPDWSLTGWSRWKDWPPHSPRSIQFIGTRGGVDSPSTSPIYDIRSLRPLLDNMAFESWGDWDPGGPPPGWWLRTKYGSPSITASKVATDTGFGVDLHVIGSNFKAGIYQRVRAGPFRGNWLNFRALANVNLHHAQASYTGSVDIAGDTPAYYQSPVMCVPAYCFFSLNFYVPMDAAELTFGIEAARTWPPCDSHGVFDCQGVTFRPF